MFFIEVLDVGVHALHWCSWCRCTCSSL